MTKKLNSFEVDIFQLFIYLYRNIKIIFIIQPQNMKLKNLLQF